MSEAVDKFAAAAVQARLRQFGRTITFNRATGGSYPLQAMVSGVSDKRKLEDGGFMHSYDFVCRIPRASIPFTPTLPDTVTIASKTFRIAEIVDHPINPEWKLGLMAKV